MTPNIKRSLYGAGASFLAMVSVCVALYPHIFRNYQYGISEFGAIHRTVIPFFIGFAATVFFLARIAFLLRTADKLLSYSFYWAAFCMGGIAATSYPIDRLWYDLHWVFVGMLVLGILAAMGMLIKRRTTSGLDYLCMALFLATTFISILPVVHDIPGVRQFIPRELLGFVSSFWVLGRAAMNGGEEPPNKTSG
jgi:hypothetical protein